MQGGRLKITESEFNPIAEMEELEKLYGKERRNKKVNTYL